MEEFFILKSDNYYRKSIAVSTKMLWRKIS